MKTIKFLKLIMIAIVTLTVASCVDSDEYDVPPTAVQEEPNVTVNSDIDAVKDAWNQNFLNNDEDLYTFEETDLFIEGYVVSSDYSGNFYKSLVIQDSPENPTHGIEILIDKTSLFETYEVGRKVYINLSGLSVSYDDGEDNFPFGVANPSNSYNPDDNAGRYQIGYDVGASYVDEIPLFIYDNNVLRSTVVATITPNPIMLSSFSENNINTFVQIANAQFSIGELGKTYAGETNDSYDASREISTCDEGLKINLETSTFADFKSYLLPEGRGTINATLGKNFFGDELTIAVNNPTDIDFVDSNRCDPVFIEAFDEGTNLNTEGWINYAEEGSEVWSNASYGGNGYARFSAYSSGDSSNIGWLISPSFDLDAQEGELLSFQTEHSYPDSGHEPLAVLISTDFDGTEAGVTTATWTELTFDVSYIVDYGGWYTFTDSGLIDISGYSGTGYIAFRYTGSDTMNQNMTLDIDNVEISVP